MVKRVNILILFLLSLVGCSGDIELDMQYLGDSSGAFIECYCQPGELYNLTATYLSPIDVAQNLDYSYKFEAYITDTEQHKLSQGLFEIDGYYYSHGSPSRLSEEFDGVLYLEIISESGEFFTASSEVPDPLDEFWAELNECVVSVQFDSSQDATQNYYTITAIATLVDGTTKSETMLSNPECDTTTDVKLNLGNIDGQISSVTVRLLRFTYDGYLYQSSILENLESMSSNLILGTPLNGNIEGARGIFTCYRSIEVVL